MGVCSLSLCVKSLTFFCKFVNRLTTSCFVRFFFSPFASSIIIPVGAFNSFCVISSCIFCRFSLISCVCLITSGLFFGSPSSYLSNNPSISSIKNFLIGASKSFVINISTVLLLVFMTCDSGCFSNSRLSNVLCSCEKTKIVFNGSN